MIRVENLSVSVQDKGENNYIIKNLDFELLNNGITVLTGNSGSGKTLFAKTISGLLNNNFYIKGDIYLRNKRIKYEDLKNYRGKTIFYLPQNSKAALNPVYKIKNQFKDLGNNIGDLKNKIEIIFKNLNFNNTKRILNSYPFELSEGECQRVVFSMGFILSPKILILDEPFASLDKKTNELIIKNIIKTNKENKNSVLLITHKKEIIKEFIAQKNNTTIKIYNLGTIKIYKD